jgi:tripartite-type tricarboxylate transporter receptor subunit TctC
MKHPRRKFLQLLAGTATLPLLLGLARAQTYPSRPITLVVPFPAGGPTDVIARTVGERMRNTLGQTVVIENASGAANGSVGIGRLARATPDGYTIGIGHWSTNVVNGAIYNLNYDLITDLEPLAQIVNNPLVLVGKNDLAAKSMQELIAWMKQNPGRALLGTAGVGSPPHVAGAFFEKLTGTKLQYVHYRGGAPSLQGLLTGEIDLLIPQPPLVLSLVRDGKIRAYAVTSNARMAAAADIPTVDEAGAPDFHVSVWHGLWAPKGTPKDILAKLNAAIVEALADPAVKTALGNIGQDISPRELQTPQGFAAFQKAEIEKWWPIVRSAGITAQ